jgi:hypothetical protein
MNLTRRDLAAAGVFALGATTLIVPSMAVTDDEEAVKQAVEALRKAILAQDKATLETLAAEQLSYSHSDAHLEDKAKFINAIMTASGVSAAVAGSEAAGTARVVFAQDFTGELEGPGFPDPFFFARPPDAVAAAILGAAHRRLRLSKADLR